MIRSSDIRGIEVPGAEEPTKATLFADDTTVFLAEEDEFEVIQAVLDKWCSASKAKFNITKTEIVPIGCKAYRLEMIREYKQTGKWKTYPENAKIADEGDAVRLLGAYVGNGVNGEAAWARRLDKVEEALGRWGKHHTSLKGKKQAVQLIVGSMTQFTADVQSQPESVTKRLNKMIRTYLWDGAAFPPVSMDQLYLPQHEGDQHGLSSWTTY
ncbi:hypothetical protein FKP32DRAFT_1608468 [Trametes sanguinea]|nr:hypothetical protein FKP32DRAFT_1608468 [Trametes sanguinea]